MVYIVLKLIMKTNKTIQLSWRHVSVLLILVLALYIFVPKLDGFRDSFQYFSSASSSLMVGAFTLILLSCVAAAGTYKCLAFKRLPFGRIVLVQYCGMFVNRLLPAGVGGMSLFVDFLYRHKHTLAQASTVVAVNNFIGSLGHGLLLLLAAAFSGSLITDVLPKNIYIFAGAVAVVGIILVGVAIALKNISGQRGKVFRFLKSVSKSFGAYRKRKIALGCALACSVFNTLLHACAVMAVAFAFDIQISLFVALVVLAGGVAAATASPTPGGVIGAEAGLTATLIAFGYNPSVSLAVALAYRLVSYWIPILIGITAFLYAQKRRYI